MAQTRVVSTLMWYEKMIRTELVPGPLASPETGQNPMIGIAVSGEPLILFSSGHISSLSVLV